MMKYTAELKEQWSNIDRKKAQDWGTKTLAVIGLLAVLAFGAWGLMRVAEFAPIAFDRILTAAVTLSSVFTPADRVDLSAPSSVLSGEPFELSWKRRNDNPGVYTISYACRDNISILAQSANGIYEKTFCETPFNFANATSSLRLLATTSVRSVDTPFSIVFTPTESAQKGVSDTAVVSLINNSAPTGDITTTPPVSGTTPTTPRTPGSPQNSIYPVGNYTTPGIGRADLVVRILATGVVDKVTGQFTPASFVRTTDRVGVRFEIENQGGTATGSWFFRAVLPSLPQHMFDSQTQLSLQPGDSIQFTLGFDSIEAKNPGVIVVNADPTGSVYENSDTNNIASTTVTVFLP